MQKTENDPDRPSTLQTALALFGRARLTGRFGRTGHIYVLIVQLFTTYRTITMLFPCLNQAQHNSGTIFQERLLMMGDYWSLGDNSFNT